MATPFEFADLSPYTQLASQQLLEQSRRNPLEEMIKAYQAPQKAAQERAAAELQAQIQQANLIALQQANDPNSPQNKMRLALDQANLARLQRDPNLDYNRRLQEDALRGIISGTNPNLVIQPVLDPEIAAARSQAEAAGGIPSTSYGKSDFMPLIPGSGNIPTIGISPSAGVAAADRKLQREITILNARAEANGVPIEYFTDTDGNLQQRPKRLYGATPGATGGVAPVLNSEGKPVQEKPKSDKGGSEAVEAAKQLQEERTRINLDAITDIRKRVSPFTVGLGSITQVVPGSPALDFNARVESLKGGIATSELQKMRSASKTGGALGSIAVKELQLLQNILGSLDPKQSKASFLDNLTKIENSIKRFDEASKKEGAKSTKLSTGLVIEQLD